MLQQQTDRQTGRYATSIHHSSVQHPSVSLCRAVPYSARSSRVQYVA